jgi:hypothetical protein
MTVIVSRPKHSSDQDKWDTLYKYESKSKESVMACFKTLSHSSPLDTEDKHDKCKNIC